MAARSTTVTPVSTIWLTSPLWSSNAGPAGPVWRFERYSPCAAAWPCAWRLTLPSGTSPFREARVDTTPRVLLLQSLTWSSNARFQNTAMRGGCSPKAPLKRERITSTLSVRWGAERSSFRSSSVNGFCAGAIIGAASWVWSAARAKPGASKGTQSARANRFIS